MLVFMAFLAGFAHCSINPLVLNYLNRMYQYDQPNSAKTASEHFAPILTCSDPVYTSKRLCKVLTARQQCSAILNLFYKPQGMLDEFVCSYREESKLRQDLVVKFPYLDKLEGALALFEYNILWKSNQIRFTKMMRTNNLRLIEEADKKLRLHKMQILLYYKFFRLLSSMEPYTITLGLMWLRISSHSVC